MPAYHGGGEERRRRRIKRRKKEEEEEKKKKEKKEEGGGRREEEEKLFLYPQMPRQKHNTSSTMNNQGNKGIHKENAKSTDKLKDMQGCALKERIQVCSSEKTEQDTRKLRKAIQ